MSSKLDRSPSWRVMGITSGGVSPASSVNLFRSTSEQSVDAMWRQRRAENDQERRALEVKHRDSYSAWLERATADCKRLPLPEVLAELSNKWGASWADIARMADVSVPALRKWRTDGGATPIKKVRLAGIAAFMRVLSELGIAEPADWVSEPIKDGYTVTPRHLYSPSNASTLLDLAGGSVGAEQVLDALAPGWRTGFVTSFEVVTLPGGDKAIVGKQNSDG